MFQKVGLLKQGVFGGTDRIFDDFRNWLDENSYSVEVLNNGQGYNIIDFELIVLPTSELHWLWSNKKKIAPKCKIMIWCMGHDALQAYFYNDSIRSVIYKKLFSYLYRHFASKLISQNVLVYTDLIAANLDLKNLEKKLIDNSRNIYPIPMQIPKFDFRERNSNLNSFYWIGRVDCDFKVWSLLELLNELNVWVIKNNVKITFSIIGNGDGIDLINSDNYSFVINKCGNLEYSKMESTLRTKASVVFAMGTSALEGAKQSIPTVIVNPLKEGEANTTYRWVYDSIGYSLGEFKSAFVYPKQKAESLELILERYIEDKTVTASKSYNFVESFNRNSIYNSIMESVNERTAFSSLKGNMFFPYISKRIKNYIRYLYRK